MLGAPAVVSSGTTPAAVDEPANVPAPGLPARSNTENQAAAMDVREADLNILTYCLALARKPSNVVIAIFYAGMLIVPEVIWIGPPITIDVVLRTIVVPDVPTSTSATFAPVES